MPKLAGRKSPGEGAGDPMKTREQASDSAVLRRKLAAAMLSLVLAGVLCGCANESPSTETMIDTSTHTQKTLRAEPPERPPLAPM
ncbi:MAG: hypothetical protein JO354_12095 [Verrucomicrobia bacterium]|nr:hypothetical protein [Verrucomicrobiota bacterium]